MSSRFLGLDGKERRSGRTIGAMTRWHSLGRIAVTPQAANPVRQVNEFKQMVKALAPSGIEVILDVVFNHTCEGNELGPTLSFKWPREQRVLHAAQRQSYYKNFSGCGNTINGNHPIVREMIFHCLRHWVHNYHIDGFPVRSGVDSKPRPSRSLGTRIHRWLKRSPKIHCWRIPRSSRKLGTRQAPIRLGRIRLSSLGRMEWSLSRRHAAILAWRSGNATGSLGRRDMAGSKRSLRSWRSSAISQYQLHHVA